MYSPPAPAAEAWQRAEEWLARPAAWIPAPALATASCSARSSATSGPTGNLIPDAHLAALVGEHGLTVISTDADFAKFRDVAWLNPVTGEELCLSP
jgi:uncharacterized protein